MTRSCTRTGPCRQATCRSRQGTCRSPRRWARPRPDRQVQQRRHRTDPGEAVRAGWRVHPDDRQGQRQGRTLLQQIKGTFSPDAMVKLAKAHAGAFARRALRPGSGCSCVSRRRTTRRGPASPTTRPRSWTMPSALTAAAARSTPSPASTGRPTWPPATSTDPSSQQWSRSRTRPALGTGRRIPERRVRSGGWDSSGNASSTVYAYDPSSGSWAQEASLRHRSARRRPRS